MALKERIVIDKVEILRNGSIQVREIPEIYDTLITPADAEEATYGDPIEVSPAVEAETVTTDKGKIVEISSAKAAVMERPELTPAKAAVTDVVSLGKYHRKVIKKDEVIPVEVQAFIDNTKGL